MLLPVPTDIYSLAPFLGRAVPVLLPLVTRGLPNYSWPQFSLPYARAESQYLQESVASR